MAYSSRSICSASLSIPYGEFSSATEPGAAGKRARMLLNTEFRSGSCTGTWMFSLNVALPKNEEKTFEHVGSKAASGFQPFYYFLYLKNKQTSSQLGQTGLKLYS